LWIGAHPGDPSICRTTYSEYTMLDAINSNPLAQV
jgi:mannose-6-phosphate isomerase class I